MSRRICHSRDGFSSSPMMNSRKTTPSSATLQYRPAVADQPEQGPDDDAGRQIAEHGAEPELLEQRRGDHRPAQQ